MKPLESPGMDPHMQSIAIKFILVIGLVIGVAVWQSLMPDFTPEPKLNPDEKSVPDKAKVGADAKSLEKSVLGVATQAKDYAFDTSKSLQEKTDDVMNIVAIRPILEYIHKLPEPQQKKVIEAVCTPKEE